MRRIGGLLPPTPRIKLEATLSILDRTSTAAQLAASALTTAPSTLCQCPLASTLVVAASIGSLARLATSVSATRQRKRAALPARLATRKVSTRPRAMGHARAAATAATGRRRPSFARTARMATAQACSPAQTAPIVRMGTGATVGRSLNAGLACMLLGRRARELPSMPANGAPNIARRTARARHRMRAVSASVATMLSVEPTARWRRAANAPS